MSGVCCGAYWAATTECSRFLPDHRAHGARRMMKRKAVLAAAQQQPGDGKEDAVRWSGRVPRG